MVEDNPLTSNISLARNILEYLGRKGASEMTTRLLYMAIMAGIVLIILIASVSKLTPGLWDLVKGFVCLLLNLITLGFISTIKPALPPQLRC